MTADELEDELIEVADRARRAGVSIEEIVHAAGRLILRMTWPEAAGDKDRSEDAGA
ncbi:hypothetical protein [Segnochrobactrum spirostomi]|uniref:hypothetical protein n=1 Tax=Segnochrobactrum spirostomi TaxID=2608987 RepID=UPI00129525FB|nr:hypothetical protein [Segnochrobactrum spirostomi]